MNSQSKFFSSKYDLFKGIFVLQDNNFKLLSQFSYEDQSVEASQNIMAFVCGLLRGTLANLGYSNMVTADIQSLPCCKRHIILRRADQVTAQNRKNFKKIIT